MINVRNVDSDWCHVASTCSRACTNSTPTVSTSLSSPIFYHPNRNVSTSFKSSSKTFKPFRLLRRLRRINWRRRPQRIAWQPPWVNTFPRRARSSHNRRRPTVTRRSFDSRPSWTSCSPTSVRGVASAFCALSTSRSSIRSPISRSIRVGSKRKQTKKNETASLFSFSVFI